MEIFDLLKSVVSYVENAPPTLLVILGLNLLGLFLKRSEFVANKFIPWILFAVGIALMIFIGPIPSGVRNPVVVLGLMGFLYAAAAVLLHKFAWKPFSRYLDDAQDTGN